MPDSAVDHPFPDSDLPEQVISEYVDRIVTLAGRWEFRRFTIGTRLKIELPEEDALNLRKTLNRRVALAVAERLPATEPVVENAEITFHLTYPGHWVEPVPTPLFVYGRYMKFTRDLPQARWLCMKCNGRGCRHCDGKGRIHETSVEEIIAEPLLEATGAEGTKMHATGRQDVDVRMLGTGRPFAIELVKPRRRFLDYRKIEEQINAQPQEGQADRRRIAVSGLQAVSRETVRQVDTVKADKSYRAVVEACEPVAAQAVMRLADLAGTTLEQQTPERVVHRRADKVRRRTLHSIEVTLPDGSADMVERFTVELRTESGAYIKEFVSSDGGRTVPSVASVLGVPCRCVELDVIAVHYDPFAEGD